MAWFLTEDPDEYLATAGGFLTSDVAANTILLVAADRLRAKDGSRGFISSGPVPGGPVPGGPVPGGSVAGGSVAGGSGSGGNAPLLGWWREPGTAIAGAFLYTPPYPAVLTSMSPDIACALAECLASRGRPLAGVNADQPAGGAFVNAWQRRTGDRPRVRVHLRLYRLSGLTAPWPWPTGRARVAQTADRDLRVAWCAAFRREESSGPENAAPVVDDRLSYGGFTLWETGEGVVSMAGMTRQVAGHVRVAPVYTPPECRRNGYAAGVTFAVSQAALDAGARDVVLFTDLANPTSNALYQRLGYRPVADRVEWSFSPRGPR